LQVVDFSTAVQLVHDGDTILIGGSGGGHAVPEKLIASLAERFHAAASPRGITLLHPVGLGDMNSQGVDRLAHAGLLKRISHRRPGEYARHSKDDAPR
jgi:propionate CoA-transferase